MQINDISNTATYSAGWATPTQFSKTTLASSSSSDQSEPSSVPVAKVAASYSPTVGGKNYPGSVLESGGVYVASVPDPPGASASGSTVQIAEHNLEVKLDELA